ncbi:MAG: hypothetical protein ONB48_13390 [candidate division KSB1 bacterium]|nr:hypothetical protein [candidate division KSB1 bacterium]MDZ7274906.1 hypothetical protein [candidate division KSB1 bacterium]MDZ7286642.1 hypothetical protein [candidate division KSB1 bacterium]MDZ7299195.1 hypothetical protein [candidate division KSB1 bacterium]MDZ7308497.1 hypothetical protein [candidate division KSB1 bacterium]
MNTAFWYCPESVVAQAAGIGPQAGGLRHVVAAQNEALYRMIFHESQDFFCGKFPPGIYIARRLANWQAGFL